jgi:cytochrome c biogenesis protein CcdA
VLLTLAVLGSGIALLLAPSSARSELVLIHKATFILWIAAFAVHVLGHSVDTARLAPKDFYWRTRRQVRATGKRQWALVGALCLGLVLAVVVAPKVGPWRSGGRPAQLISPVGKSGASDQSGLRVRNDS